MEGEDSAKTTQPDETVSLLPLPPSLWGCPHCFWHQGLVS